MTGSNAPSAARVATSGAAPRALVSLGDLFYALYRAVPLGWLVALARLRGGLQLVLRPTHRRAVRRNLGDLIGAQNADLDALTARFFQNQQIQNLLVMLTPRMSTATLERVVRFERLDRLDRALADGRGVIMLASHLNSASTWVAISLLRRRGYDVRVAMPIPGDPWVQSRLRRLLDRIAGRVSLREQIGAFYVQFNVRPIVDALAQNAVVGMTGDGWHSAAFLAVEFLGHEVPFTTGAMSVARATGAVVVPVFMAGEPLTSVRLVFEEPFTVPKTREAREDIHAAVRRYAPLLSGYVRSNIAGWQHLEIPDLLETMRHWRQRPLADRYSM